MAHRRAINDVIAARKRLLELPPDGENGRGDRLEHAPADWLMLLVCDLGQLGASIKAFRWAGASGAEIRRTAVELGGHVLGFIEQLDAEQNARNGRH